MAAAKGDARAALTMEIEAYRIKKYIGAYSAAVGGIDAVVFTAGVGEKGAVTRAKALGGLEALGINLDENKNALSTTRNAETIISADNSRVKIFIIPTDEERVFVEDAAGLLKGNYNVHAKFHYSFQDMGYRNAMRDKAFEKECAKKPGLEKIAALPPGKR
jgi:acetate kinase